MRFIDCFPSDGGIVSKKNKDMKKVQNAKSKCCNADVHTRGVKDQKYHEFVCEKCRGVINGYVLR